MTLATLARPEDLWIVPVVVFGIILAGTNKQPYLGSILILVTSIPVAFGYGISRGIIHIVLSALLSRLLDALTQKVDSNPEAE